MIKAAGTTGTGRPLLIIGLSAESVRRLIQGMPIRFDTEQLGLPGMTVLVVAGETEESIAEDLRGAHLIDERTQFQEADR